MTRRGRAGTRRDGFASDADAQIPADTAHALVDEAVRLSRREGFGYGVAAGSLAVAFIGRLLDWLWP